MLRPVKVGEFLHRKKVSITIDPEEIYSLVTVKLHHNGVVLREKKKGALLGSTMYRISEGDFILSGIDARNGAFGIVPAELDGAIVTNDFWYFDVDETKVKRDFFYWLTTTSLFLDACQKSSKGETQRIRLQKELFNNFTFHFPPVEDQEEFLENISRFDATLNLLSDETTNQFSYLAQLHQAVLQEAIEGKLTAEWRKSNPVRKGDPDYDAVALLAKIKSEKEKLIAEGKIKKQNPLSPIKLGEVPFRLPDGWVWTRLAGIYNSITYGTSEKCSYENSNNAKVLRIPNLSSGIINDNDLKFTKLSEKELQEFLLKYGDVLTIRSNGSSKIVGTMAFVTEAYENYCFAGYLIRLRFLDPLIGQFVSKVSKAKCIRCQIEDPLRTTVGINNINTQELSNLSFPLPPLAEQRAIVERVEKLLSMVDELEKKVAERKNQAEILMQTVLREAFEGKDADNGLTEA